MVIFTNLIKNTTTFTNLLKRINRYLLKEDGFFLLLEDNGKIYIDKGTELINQNKNTITFTNLIKN